MTPTKHAFVSETLTATERIASFAVLGEPESEPLPRPTRALIVWQGDDWAEIDPETGDILCCGSVPDAPSGRLAERVSEGAPK